MYFNIVKREVETKKFVKIAKSYKCFGVNDYDIKFRAKSWCNFKNLVRYFYNKYQYVVEFDFE